MRNIIYIAFLIFCISGCRSYVQVLQVETTNTSRYGEFYVFETDTLKITYAFWAEKGILSFAVYNKLEKPIYIDWMKSSFIDKSNKFDYWIDAEISKTISYYGSHYYSGPLLRPEIAVSKGVGTTTSTKVKPERITFIPPKSNYFRSQFYLYPKQYIMYKLADYHEVKRNGTKNKYTKVYFDDFQRENTPLYFRNFLTFSMTESFEEEFYVDNEFYISNIKEMDSRHFKSKTRDERDRYIYIHHFTNQSTFYLNVPKKASIEYRKRLNVD